MIRRFNLSGGGGGQRREVEPEWGGAGGEGGGERCWCRGEVLRGLSSLVSGRIVNKNFTFEPWILKTCKVLADSEAVTRAVNIEMMMTPVIIQRMQNTRPRADLGERSPYLWVKGLKKKVNQSTRSILEKEIKTSNTYPTVVMVTRAHQKPSQDPRRNGGGNSPGLLAWSYRQKNSLISKQIYTPEPLQPSKESRF